MWQLNLKPSWGAIVLLAAVCMGCSGGSTEPAEKTEPVRAPERQDGMTAGEIMEKMVATYREADTYMDNAEYGEHFILPDDGVMQQGPSVMVTVMLNRPNRFRIVREAARLDGPSERVESVSDGTKLEATVSRLPEQRLSVPAPEVATLESVAPDPVLREELFPAPVQDMFPQLALLLAADDQKPWPLQAPAGLVLLPQKQLRREHGRNAMCYRVRMPTTMGPQICWIEKDTFLLRRIEITNDELREHLYPNQEFTEFSWQFNFDDATFDAQITKSGFRLPPIEGSDVEVVEALVEEESKPEDGPAIESPPVDEQPDTDDTEQEPPADEAPAAESEVGEES